MKCQEAAAEGHLLSSAPPLTPSLPRTPSLSGYSVSPSIMAPPFRSAKLTLSCPLFAADFDPRNNGFLLVAGGGGEGRSGVGNKIALLNTSKRNEISEVVDIELSRDEDSVTSLAAAHANNHSIIAFAGINSSVVEQKRDNNQHLRSFQIDYPPRKQTSASEGETQPGGSPAPKEPEKPTATPGKTTPLSRASLFRTKDKSRGSGDTYQRITRLSPWKDVDSPRVAAIATGLAPSGEIVFFKAVATPSASDVIGRIRLNGDEEAEDVDITNLEEDGTFRVAYTNGVDVFVCQICSETKSNASPEVKSVFSLPLPEKGGRKARPKLRAVRFLSPTTLLLLQNAPERTGCELVLLQLSDAGAPSANKSHATVLSRKTLRKAIKIGLGLEVCNLGANSEGQQQTAIAVSGSDQSIEILTVDYNGQSYTKLRPYNSLRDVHPFSMTKLCFSHFIPPPQPVTPETPPQYIKLASVSMGNTVVVHTFPLSPSPPSSRAPRYVLVPPSEIGPWDSVSSVITSVLSILLVCLLVQAFTEVRGVMPPRLGIAEWLPPDVRDAIAVPYNPGPGLPSSHLSKRSASAPIHTTAASAVVSSMDPSELPSLRELLRPADSEESDPALSSIHVRCDRASNEIIIESSVSPQSDSDDLPPRWEDLSEHDKSVWKQLLTDASHWAVEDGETILHGVRFGTVCLPLERE